MYHKLNQILSKNQDFSTFKMVGFFTAVISSPNLIHPLQWMKIAKISQSDLKIIFRLYKQIYLALRESNYKVVLHKSILASKFSNDLSGWGSGYLLGESLWKSSIVELYRVEINKLLSELLRLSRIIICDDVINDLSKVCVEIYNFWLERAIQ